MNLILYRRLIGKLIPKHYTGANNDRNNDSSTKQTLVHNL